MAALPSKGLKGRMGSKEVYDRESGATLFEGRSSAVWAWLRTEGYYPLKRAPVAEGP